MSNAKDISPGSCDRVLTRIPIASNSDIIKDIRIITPIAIKQLKNIAMRFKRSTIYETCHNIWNWIKTNIRYQADPSHLQITKLPTKLLRDRVGDCKSMALFAYAILANLNISCAYRWAYYSGEIEPSHVYVIVIDNNGKEIIVDPTLPTFNTEAPYIFKRDTDMEYQSIAGAGNRMPQPISNHPTIINSPGQSQPVGGLLLAAIGTGVAINEGVKSTTGKGVIEHLSGLLKKGSSNANNASLRRELDQFTIPVDFDLDKYGRDNPDIPTWANKQGLNSHAYVLKLIAAHWFIKGQSEGRPYPYKDGYPKPAPTTSTSNTATAANSIIPLAIGGLLLKALI